MRRNYHRKLWGEIITGNYEEKLSPSIFHHAKNVGILGKLAYPKNKVVIWSKEGGREGYRERVREIKGNRERDGEK